MLSSMRVARGQCNQQISRPATPRCNNAPTVAYAFIMRDQFNYWEVWRRFFHGCNGAAIPVVHSQAGWAGACNHGTTHHLHRG